MASATVVLCQRCGSEIPEKYTHMCGIAYNGPWPFRWKVMQGPNDAIAIPDEAPLVRQKEKGE